MPDGVFSAGGRGAISTGAVFAFGSGAGVVVKSSGCCSRSCLGLRLGGIAFSLLLRGLSCAVVDGGFTREVERLVGTLEKVRPCLSR